MTEEQLTGRSIGGAVAFAVQTLVVKSSTILSQIVLAYLLVPEDFGLIAVATAAAAYTGALFRRGLAHVLVERAQDTEDLAQHAFWLSMAMGTLATGMTAAVAPLVAAAVGEPEVRNLIWILAPTAMIQAASVVPRAHLMRDMQFGALARINGGQIVLRGALTIFFAWLDFGAYSFALGEVMATTIELWLYRRRHPLAAGRPTDREDWRGLSRDTLYFVSAGLLDITVNQADYFILGVFAPASEVGLYYFAFRLSVQGVMIFTRNMGRVLFPALAHLPRGSERQHRAFVRAVRALAGIGLPIGVLGVALGQDVILLVFGPEWSGAGTPLRILSAAAAVRTVSAAYHHLLTAQGRFRDDLRWSIVVTATFLPVVAFGSWAGGAIGAAIAVATHASLAGWCLYTLTVRPSGGTAWELPRLVAAPTVACGAPAAIGLVASAALGYRAGDIEQFALCLGLVAVGYLPLLRALSPATSGELSTIWRHLMDRLPIRRRRAASRPG